METERENSLSIQYQEIGTRRASLETMEVRVGQEGGGEGRKFSFFFVCFIVFFLSFSAR